jgi:GT2 family glycosyltransferase
LPIDAEQEVSVVIAAIVGAKFLDECLGSLETQAKKTGAETIVVACGTAEFAGEIAERHPWVRVIHRPERESVPTLRSHGVEAAQGRIIAIIEEHCVAAPDWLERALEAHSKGEYGAVGGPVAPQDYDRLRDWVVYFCEYNNQMPPWQDGETTSLGSANIAYKREVLLRYKDLLHTGYWEAGLHWRMLADGIKFRAAPKMVVYHCGPFNFGYYLEQRFWFSRAFSSARGLTAAKKLVYICLSPLLPVLLAVRMAQRVVKQNCHVAKFIQILTLLVPVLLVYVTGEVVGYVAGQGDSLLRVE